MDFLTQVLEIAPYSDTLLSHLQGYSARLASQLPILQQVTRREFIKYRLKCIHRFQSATVRGQNPGEFPLQTHIFCKSKKIQMPID